MKHNIDYINNLKLQNRLFKVIAFFSLCGAILYITKPPIVSPCPETGCHIKTVYAKEEQTELEQITQYIIKKWQPHGRQEAVKALACFISESKLRPDAYNFNKNNTWDFGIAQWNQVHGQTIDEIRDWKKQIDLAYTLWLRRGWNQWYGYGCK